MRGIVLALLALAPTAWGQTVFDHFDGTIVDQGRWMSVGDVHASVANSLLRFNMPIASETSLVAQDPFHGDFTVDLQVDGFQATTGTSTGYLSLFVLDGEISPFGFVELRLAETGAGRLFQAYGELNSQGQGTSTLATSATAARLRIRRGQQSLTLEVLEAGATTWTLLHSFPDFLSPLAYVEIHAHTGADSTLLAECDQISTSGLTLPAPVRYGTACGGLRCRSWSLPYIGNRRFGQLLFGDPQLAGASVFMVLGTGRVAWDLSGIGATGCTLLAYPDFIIPCSPLGANAEGRIFFAIPTQTVLVGAILTSQFIALGGTANPLGLSFSNGLESTIIKL